MRADRLLSILILLQARGNMTAQALADKLEVSRRTILRDINALSIAGVPISAEGGHGGGIFLDENYRISLTGLNEAEMHALFISDTPRPLKEMGLEKASEDVLVKLFAALPLQHQEEVERFRQRIHVDSVWWGQEGKLTPFLSLLERAVFENRCIQGMYERSNGEVAERTLNPYGLVAKGNTWYLVAEHHGELRTYRVSRFSEVVLLDHSFQRQEHFDLPAYWRDHSQQFEKTLLQFSFTLAVEPESFHLLTWYAEGQFQMVEFLNHEHEKQERDGWPLVSLKMSSLEAARLFVLRLGKHTHVIEPYELHTAVIEAAQEIIAFHAQK
jgi:predicted DNA-binding transcriptional regulator YafY